MRLRHGILLFIFQLIALSSFAMQSKVVFNKDWIKENFGVSTVLQVDNYIKDVRIIVFEHKHSSDAQKLLKQLKKIVGENAHMLSSSKYDQIYLSEENTQTILASKLENEK